MSLFDPRNDTRKHMPFSSRIAMTRRSDSVMRQDPSGTTLIPNGCAGEAVEIHRILWDCHLRDGFVINIEDPDTDNIEWSELGRYTKVVESLKSKPILQSASLLLDRVELIGRRLGSGRSNFYRLSRECSGPAKKHPDQQADQQQEAYAYCERSVLADLRSPCASPGQEGASRLVDFRPGVCVERNGFQVLGAGAIEVRLSPKLRRQSAIPGGDSHGTLHRRFGIVLTARAATKKNLTGALGVHEIMAFFSRRAERVLSIASASRRSSTFSTHWISSAGSASR